LSYLGVQYIVTTPILIELTTCLVHSNQPSTYRVTHMLRIKLYIVTTPILIELTTVYARRDLQIRVGLGLMYDDVRAYRWTRFHARRDAISGG
jgi:hypothetical protein